MAGEPVDHTFEVSDYFLRLASEAVRLFSIANGRLATFSELVDARAPCGSEAVARHAQQTLRGHLETIPSTGPLRVEMTLSPGSAAALLKARVQLAERLEQAATLTDAVSVLLFDYVVEEFVARQLAGAGDDTKRSDQVAPLPAELAGNILRLR